MRRLIKGISRLLYWNAPDRVYYILLVLYGPFDVFSLRVKEIVLVFPYQGLWIACQKDLEIFIPNAKEAYRGKNLSKHIVLKEYTFEPCMILDYGRVILDIGCARENHARRAELSTIIFW